MAQAKNRTAPATVGPMVRGPDGEPVPALPGPVVRNSAPADDGDGDGDAPHGTIDGVGWSADETADELREFARETIGIEAVKARTSKADTIAALVAYQNADEAGRAAMRGDH